MQIINAVSRVPVKFVRRSMLEARGVGLGWGNVLAPVLQAAMIATGTGSEGTANYMYK